MRARIGMMVLCVVLPTLCARGLFAQERWVYRYNGPADSSDLCYSIAVGPDTNVYAAGYSHGIGTSRDFTAVSLTASGSERWVYRYDGPGSSSDEAYSIAVGSDGNLYAAGYSIGVGTSRDFTVVSLTDSGAERWVYRYEGLTNHLDDAYSITVAPDGNLYAAGWTSGGGSSGHFTVVSLTAAGVERWIYQYDGPGDGPDGANSIIVGSDGNLYAAGSSWGSGTADDFTVVSLTDSGTERWVYRYNGPGNAYDRANSVIDGSDGNLYAAGWSYGSGTYEDFTVVSLTDSGTERWVYRYNGSGDGSDYAYSLVMGSDGNLYAAGRSIGIGSSHDFTVLSLTGLGGERWVYSCEGVARSIIVGSDANLYAAGWGWAAGSYYDFTVVCLSDSGVEGWVYRYNGSANDVDGAYSVVTGPDGNLYAAGGSEEIGADCDFTVVSLSPDVGVSEHGGKTTAPLVLQLSVSPIPAPAGVRISYSLPNAAEVRLSVYDVSGRLVKNLVSTREESGSRVVHWDGKDSQDRRVTSGTYFVRLEACGLCTFRKLIIL